MAHHKLAIALSMIVATSAVSAAQPEPSSAPPAPAAGPDAKYCLRVEPFTGSNIETIKCWTREEWAEQGVDVDEAWAKDGVAVKG